jgi:hypothetical protein
MSRALTDSSASGSLPAWLLTVDHRVQIYGYNYSHAKRAAFLDRRSPVMGD